MSRGNADPLGPDTHDIDQLGWTLLLGSVTVLLASGLTFGQTLIGAMRWPKLTCVLLPAPERRDDWRGVDRALQMSSGTPRDYLNSSGKVQLATLTAGPVAYGSVVSLALLLFWSLCRTWQDRQSR